MPAEFCGTILTIKGIEKTCSQEIRGLTEIKNTEAKEGAVIFKTKNIKDLCKLCYLSQSATRVLLVLSKFKFQSLENYCKKISGAIKKQNIEHWVKNNGSYCTECIRINNEQITSMQIEQETNKVIQKELNKKKITARPEFKKPETMFITYINGDECIFGIDFAGFDLGKRHYKVFPNKNSVKGPFAYALLKIIGYSENDYLLNVFCGDGVIAIEAALEATHFPVRYYQKEDFAFRKFKIFEKENFDTFFDEIDVKIGRDTKINIRAVDGVMGNIIAAKKNAKIAGILKKIEITRITMDWLDVKIKEKQADKIIGLLPQPSKNIPEKNTKQNYDNFFYQAEYILKEDGKILALTKSEQAKKLLLEAAEKYKFKQAEEKELWQGSIPTKAIVLVKQY